MSEEQQFTVYTIGLLPYAKNDKIYQMKSATRYVIFATMDIPKVSPTRLIARVEAVQIKEKCFLALRTSHM
jgi:hypothetical protein